MVEIVRVTRHEGVLRVQCPPNLAAYTALVELGAEWRRNGGCLQLPAAQWEVVRRVLLEHYGECGEPVERAVVRVRYEADTVGDTHLLLYGRPVYESYWGRWNPWRVRRRSRWAVSETPEGVAYVDGMFMSTERDGRAVVMACAGTVIDIVGVPIGVADEVPAAVTVLLVQPIGHGPMHPDTVGCARAALRVIQRWPTVGLQGLYSAEEVFDAQRVVRECA